MNMPRSVGRVCLGLVDHLRNTDALRLHREYLDSQWLPPETIARAQQEGLRRLLEHASRHVPYYREYFRENGLDPADFRSPADLRRLPIVDKQVIKARPKDFLAENMAEFQPHRKSTGGSSGDTLAYYLDRRSRSAHWASMYRAWSVGGWQPGDAMVHLGGTSILPSAQSLKRWLYVRLNNWTPFSAFEISEENMDRWLERMRRSGVRFMYGYASSVYLLARRALDRNFRDVRLRAVFTSAEPLYPACREAIERAFSCVALDTYGANDGGGFAFDCGHGRGLHCVSERAVLEIVTDDGAPAAEGEAGDILSTDLLNYAMPFIRYRVGDVAAVSGESCPCGRGLPLLRSIQGRSHDYVATPTGERVHGEYFAHLVRGLEWVRQFCVVQESPEELVFNLKTGADRPERGLQAIQDVLERKFPGMRVRVVLTETMPQAASGKHRFVINNARSGEAGAWRTAPALREGETA